VFVTCCRLKTKEGITEWIFQLQIFPYRDLV